MGVPVVNSTLKELLPLSISGTFDESALLSASDLITLLDRIRTRSEGIKEKVHKTVTTYNKEFKRIILQANNTAADVDSVSDELESFLELFGESVGKNVVNDRNAQSSKRNLLKEKGSSNIINGLDTQKSGIGTKAPVVKEEAESSENVPLDIELCNLASKVHTLHTRIKEREEALVVVKSISCLFEQLLSTQRKFTPGHLVEAANDMRTLQKRLGLDVRSDDQPCEDVVGDVKAFKLLRDSWTERFEKLVHILEEMTSRAIVLNESTSELSVISPVTCENPEVVSDSAAIDLSAIFTAMDVMGVLNERLAKLGDAVQKHILAPILRDPQTSVLTTDQTENNLIRRRSLALQASVTHGQSVEPVIILFPKIVQVIKFLHKEVFGDHTEWMARFGRLLWPRLADAIISTCLKKAVPNETSELKGFHKIAELTESFEMEIANEGLIANYDRARGDKLSTFTSDVEVHFALRKKEQVLAKARDLLMNTDYSLSGSSWGRSNPHHQEGTDAFEDRSIYLLQESCAISSLARKLLAIVHEAVEDACLSTPRTAMELYHAARDTILLYRAIIPVKLGSKMNSLSQVAALCHNDCLYIAHELLTFVYQYGKVLPPSLKEIFTFVDLVPLFRRMAEEVLDRQIGFVDEEIMMRLDHARGFQRTDDQEQYEITQQTVQKVLDIFKNFATLWRPVLSYSLYRRVMSGLIDNVVSRIVSEVLAIPDIAVQETVQLQELLIFVQENLSPLLALPSVDELKGDQALVDSSPEDSVEKSVPSWRKLESLRNLLDMSLVSITQAWESGDLISRGFSAAEVQKFIRAIFSETAHREECLQRIGSRF
ncbi:protein transport protein DSL1/ZW10 [Marchantia polymorpha subsp. ruderalis]